MNAPVRVTKWLIFELYPYVKRGQKTSVYHIRTREGGEALGEIRWWGRWRKYAFFPAHGTLYEPTCLRDIATFIDDLMAERKLAKKAT